MYSKSQFIWQWQLTSGGQSHRCHNTANCMQHNAVQDRTTQVHDMIEKDSAFVFI